MCPHEWKKYGECWVCMRCGITKLPNGKIFFDRKLPNYKAKKGKAVKGGNGKK